MDRILLALVLHAAPLPSLAHAPVQVLGLAGKPVSLEASVAPDFRVRDVIWRSHTPAEELVATAFKGTPEILYRSRFYGRIRLYRNLTLEIDPAGPEDGGTFSVLLVDTRGNVKQQIFHLAVYGMLSRRKRDVAEAVSVPTIRVFAEASDPNDSAGSSCALFFTCTTPGGSNVTYSWAGPEGKGVVGGKHTVLENGQVLWAELDPKDDAQVMYTCTVANAVSRKSAAVDVQGLCRKQSGAKDSDHDYRTILLIVVPLASLLLSAAAVLIVRSKQRAGGKTSYTVSGSEPVPV